MFTITVDNKFLGDNIKEFHHSDAPQVCLMQRFGKVMNKRESFKAYGRVMELNDQNNFTLNIKESGFYELRCYYLVEKPNWFKRFYNDIFTILPKV